MSTLIIVFITAIFVLFSGIFFQKNIGKFIALIGLLIALAANVWNVPVSGFAYESMLSFGDNQIRFINIILLVSFLLFAISGEGLLKVSSAIEDHLGLFLFSICGAIVMLGAQHFVMLFLGIEIMSIPLYVLAGSRIKNFASNEAAMKYFLMGSFATGILLFGTTFIYGSTAHFDYAGITNALIQSTSSINGITIVGICLLAVGLLFKVSAAPFHFWSPDVYEGSPNLVTAFMSTVVKVSGFFALATIFSSVFIGQQQVWMPVIAAVSAFTMMFANITAISQFNIKRLLAYSSVSHAGYMLMALLAVNFSAFDSLWVYLFSYVFASVAIFSVIFSVHNSTDDLSLNSFQGLAKHSPLSAFVVTVALLSMAGVPPLFGFFGKYALFVNIFSNYPWLVIVAILSSTISVYYYFRVIRSMYFETSNISVADSLAIKIVGIICAIIILLGAFVFPYLS